MAGLTAEDIADRMDCSLRLVRSIRAEPMTQVCVHMQNESRNFFDELRLSRSEVAQAHQNIAALKTELARTRGKLDRLLDAHITGTKVCGKCGTPMSGYNVYTQPATGKQFCRECHRRRQQKYREAAQQPPLYVLVTTSTVSEG